MLHGIPDFCQAPHQCIAGRLVLGLEKGVGRNRARDVQDWQTNPLTPEEKRRYARAMQDQRAAYGLTDRLRTDRKGLQEYLERRRAEDARARGWG